MAFGWSGPLDCHDDLWEGDVKVMMLISLAAWVSCPVGAIHDVEAAIRRAGSKRVGPFWGRFLKGHEGELDGIS